jgi:hypothetical protein
MTSITKSATVPSASSPETSIRYGIIVVAALLILIALYCRVRLLPIPLERDEGGFAYIGQQLLNGVPPFKSGNMKVLGGIHFAYAGIMAFFGEHARGIHSGLLLVNVSSMWLMYCLGRRLFGRDTAILTAAVFAYLTASQSVLGVFAHATHFVMLFVLAGLVLLFKGVEENRRILLSVSGLALGCALLMKQHGVFFCLFSVCFLAWKRYAQGLGRKAILADVASFTAGMLVPYLGTCLYMLLNGVFAEFWFWTFEYSLNYAGTTTLAQGLQNLSHKFGPQYRYLKYAWLLGCVGLLATCRRGGAVRERWFVPCFFLTALLAITPGNMYYRHYFVLVIPPLALLIGAAFEELSHKLATVASTGAARKVAVGVVSLVFAICIYGERHYLFTLGPQAVSRNLYGNDLFVVSDKIARYIRENSDSQAKVAIIGSEPQIYFNAKRAAATDYLYMYSLDRPHEFLTEMQDEMIGEIEKAAPEYIVYVGAYDSWAAGAAGDRVLNWANSYLVYYYQIGFIDLGVREDSTCTWGPEAESRLPSLSQYVTVFRRSS